MNEICDLVVAVSADVENRISRLLKRDIVDADEIRNRINSQISDRERTKKADIIIDNNCDMNELARQVEEVIRKIVRDS